MKPKYAIVRVNKFCPRDLERNYKLKCIGSLHCDKCKIKKNYGDTKEQLIAKVKQAIERIVQQRYIEVNYRNFKMSYTTKSLAKEIVEFLGVEK